MGAPDLVTVPLSAGGSLDLRAGINAYCDFEAEVARAGLDPLRELARIENAMRATMTSVRALVWALARRQRPGLTLEQVGDMLEADGPAINLGVAEALARAAPDKPAEGGAPSGKPTPPSV